MKGEPHMIILYYLIGAVTFAALIGLVALLAKD